MNSEHYQILVTRLTEEMNRIRDKQKQWLIDGNLKMLDAGEEKLAHIVETIRFIKKVDKEMIDSAKC